MVNNNTLYTYFKKKIKKLFALLEQSPTPPVKNNKRRKTSCLPVGLQTLPISKSSLV